MSNPSSFSPDMQPYFDELPVFLQESIVQSGVCVETLQDLRDLANHLLGAD